MTLSQIMADEESGLVVDVLGAARNRENIERMRKGETRTDKPTKRLYRDFKKDFEKDKDKIVADYQQLTMAGFYKKWHLNSSGWKRLKKKWKVEGKGRYSHGKPAVSKAETKAPSQIIHVMPEIFQLDERELHMLMNLGIKTLLESYEKTNV